MKCQCQCSAVWDFVWRPHRGLERFLAGRRFIWVTLHFVLGEKGSPKSLENTSDPEVTMKLKEVLFRNKGTGVFLVDFSVFAVPKQCAPLPLHCTF